MLRSRAYRLRRACTSSVLRSATIAFRGLLPVVHRHAGAQQHSQHHTAWHKAEAREGGARLMLHNEKQQSHLCSKCGKPTCSCVSRSEAQSKVARSQLRQRLKPDKLGGQYGSGAPVALSADVAARSHSLDAGSTSAQDHHQHIAKPASSPLQRRSVVPATAPAPEHSLDDTDAYVEPVYTSSSTSPTRHRPATSVPYASLKSRQFRTAALLSNRQQLQSTTTANNADYNPASGSNEQQQQNYHSIDLMPHADHSNAVVKMGNILASTGPLAIHAKLKSPAVAVELTQPNDVWGAALPQLTQYNAARQHGNAIAGDRYDDVAVGYSATGDSSSADYDAHFLLNGSLNEIDTFVTMAATGDKLVGSNSSDMKRVILYGVPLHVIQQQQRKLQPPTAVVRFNPHRLTVVLRQARSNTTDSAADTLNAAAAADSHDNAATAAVEATDDNNSTNDDVSFSSHEHAVFTYESVRHFDMHGDVTIYTPKQWLTQQALFESLLTMKVFAQYPLWKCMRAWKSMVRMSKFLSIRHTIGSKLILLDLACKNTLATIRTALDDILTTTPALTVDKGTSAVYAFDEYLQEQQQYINTVITRKLWSMYNSCAYQLADLAYKRFEREGLIVKDHAWNQQKQPHQVVTAAAVIGSVHAENSTSTVDARTGKQHHDDSVTKHQQQCDKSVVTAASSSDSTYESLSDLLMSTIVKDDGHHKGFTSLVAKHIDDSGGKGNTNNKSNKHAATTQQQQQQCQHNAVSA
eukprot:21556-Heterococcus_DN1.PRE.2